MLFFEESCSLQTIGLVGHLPGRIGVPTFARQAANLWVIKVGLFVLLWALDAWNFTSRWW